MPAQKKGYFSITSRFLMVLSAGKSMAFQKPDSVRLLPVLTWLVYTIVYLGRINLSISIPFLQNEFGYSKATLGFLASGFFVSYAAGQLINGVMGDRVQARYFVSLGLIAAGISNIIFSVTRSFPVMFIVWSGNGYFQSMLWGPMLRTITDYIPPQKRFRALFLMSTSPVIGYFLSYILSGQLAVNIGWEAAFLVPGILFMLIAGTWYWGIGKIAYKTPDQTTPRVTGSMPGMEIINFFFQSKIYLLVILGVLVGIAKEGLILWSPSIFTEFFTRELGKTLFLLSLMPVINFCFVILNGVLYKKYPGKEHRIIIVYLATAILSTTFIWHSANYIFFIRSFFFYCLMASLYAITIFMASYLPCNYMKNGRVSATAGIIDSSFYLGAAIAGPLMGTMAEKFGWAGIFAGIMVICAAALLPNAILHSTFSK